MPIRAGMKVMVRTATDEWVEARTLSGVEGTHRDGRKIHDFPVIWVSTSADGVEVPWPAEDVREVM